MILIISSISENIPELNEECENITLAIQSLHTLQELSVLFMLDNRRYTLRGNCNQIADDLVLSIQGALDHTIEDDILIISA